MNAPRKPNFKLSATTRQGVTPIRKGQIGVGWGNTDGSISIKLDPFVYLHAADNLVITLFPADKPQPTKATEPE